ncbi:hypothetical protein D3C75_892310 [compost metagenome]
MVFPVFYIGGGTDWGMAAELFLLALLYFVGTALYVKTIIREKNNPRYYYASVIYHGVFLLSGVVVFPSLTVPLMILLARAAGFPRTKISAKRTGMLEIGFSVMLYISVWVLYF